VTVRYLLEGTDSVWRDPQCLGRYEATGAPLAASTPRRLTHPRAHRLDGATPRAHPVPHYPRQRLTRPRRGPRLPVGPRA
jgi:hypothetical protein